MAAKVPSLAFGAPPAVDRRLRGVTFCGLRPCPTIGRLVRERFEAFAWRHAGIVSCRVAVTSASEEPFALCHFRIGVATADNVLTALVCTKLDGDAVTIRETLMRAFGEIDARLDRVRALRHHCSG